MCNCQTSKGTNRHLYNTLNREDAYSILLLFAVVVVILLPWYALNQRVPIWDEASFANTAQNILNKFANGITSGIAAEYFVRGWRPILFPVIATPFFALAHDNMLLGIGLTEWFALTLLGVYVFFLLREFLPRPHATIGTIFVITSPWLLNYGYKFYSELFWMASTAGFVYHFTVAGRRNPRIHFSLAGVWLGIMATIRPAESPLIAVLPFLGALIQQFRFRLVAFIAFLAASLIASLIVWMLIVISSVDYRIWTLLIIYMALVIIFSREFFIRVPILGTAIIAEAIFLAWYAPMMKPLYSWAFEASFGPMAKLPYGRLTGSFVVLLGKLSGEYNLALLAILVAFSAPTFLKSDKIAAKETAKIGALGVLWMSLLMGIPVLAMLFATGTADMRRVLPSILLLYVGVAGLVLVPKYRFSGIRFIILSSLTAAQFLIAANNSLALEFSPLRNAETLFGSLRSPSLKVDANTKMIRKLVSLGVTTGGVAIFSLCYRDPVVGCTKRGLPVIGPEALTAVAKQEHLGLHMAIPRDLDLSKPNTLAAQLVRRGYSLVLVDMFDKPAEVVPADPVFGHTQYFINLIHFGLPRGLLQVAQFTLGGRQFRLLRVKLH